MEQNFLQNGECPYKVAKYIQLLGFSSIGYQVLVSKDKAMVMTVKTCAPIYENIKFIPNGTCTRKKGEKNLLLSF